MTHVEVTEGSPEPRLTKKLAARFVNQLIEEAWHLSNVSLETGKSWRNLLTLKHLEGVNLFESRLDNPLVSMQADDSIVNIEKCETLCVLTSTPQKMEERDQSIEDIDGDVITSINEKNKKCTNEVDLISDVSLNEINKDLGQGDVDLIPLSFRLLMDALAATPKIEKQPNHFNDTYSVIKLEMSDVSTADAQTITKNPFQDEIANMIVSHSNDVQMVEQLNMTKADYDEIVNNILSQRDGLSILQTVENEEIQYRSKEDARHSQIEHAIVETPSQDYENSIKNLRNKSVSYDVDKENEEIISEVPNEQNTQHSDVGLLERTFLTLNRDDEVCSDADSSGGDPTKLSMQEVDLCVASTSDERITLNRVKVKQQEDEPAKGDTLIRRCRLQGNRIWSWLRGILRKRILLRRPRKRSRKTNQLNMSPMLRQKKMSRTRVYEFDSDIETPDGTWKNVPEQCPYARRRYLETFI